MTAMAKLQSALDEFERIQSAIVAAGTSRPEGWQRTLVELRRDLQAVIVRLRQESQACEPREPGLVNEFQRALSALRTAVALHQAQWPAVNIEWESPSYIESLATLKKATNEFRRLAAELVVKLKS